MISYNYISIPNFVKCIRIKINFIDVTGKDLHIFIGNELHIFIVLNKKNDLSLTFKFRSKAKSEQIFKFLGYDFWYTTFALATQVY
jgi:antitoxin component HigA of HigAB toxin-antitoxin module